MKNQNNKINDKKVDEQVKKISGAMAQEGMPLTDEIKENIRKCLIGESTTEIECEKVIDRYKQYYE